MSFPDFPYLIIWSKPEGDFVAIEPWGGLSTCSDEGDVFEEKRGCLTAKPGETVKRAFSIESSSDRLHPTAARRDWASRRAGSAV